MSRSARSLLHNFIPARVFSLAFPVMLGMMSQVLLNVVDAAMVGQLGAAELAAAGLGSMAFMVVAMAFEALGTGTQILVAREWGGKNPSAASRVLSNSLVLTLPLGLLLSSLAIFKVLPFIPFLVDEPRVQELTTIYVRYRFLCLFFFLIFSSFRGYFDGVGKTQIRMKYMIIVVGLNIVFNYILIFGKWGFPRMEVAGAALASTLAVFVGTVYILICAWYDKVFKEYPFFRRRNFHWKVVWNIAYYSFPKGARMFFFFGAFLVFFKFVGMTEILPEKVAAVLAATNILITILSFSFMPGVGIGIAGATLVGQSLGAGKVTAARHYGWAATRFGVLFMGLSGLLYIIFPREIISFFSRDPLVISQGYWPLIILGAVQGFNGVGTVLSQSLEGAGATHWVLAAELIIYWLFLLPATYFFAIHLGWGLTAAWGCIGVMMILYAGVMIRKFRSESWAKIIS